MAQVRAVHSWHFVGHELQTRFNNSRAFDVRGIFIQQKRRITSTLVEESEFCQRDATHQIKELINLDKTMAASCFIQPHYRHCCVKFIQKQKKLKNFTFIFRLISDGWIEVKHGHDKHHAASLRRTARLRRCPICVTVCPALLLIEAIYPSVMGSF